VAGIAANGKDREWEKGAGGDFNFLATNSKPQIAKTNRETKGGSACLASQNQSQVARLSKRQQQR